MPRLPSFADRREAGRQLAESLSDYRDKPGTVVLALPRGGLPVAYEIARSLAAPLDVVIVRKLGVPGHEELAMGAIASGGVRVLNEGVIDALGITPEMIERVAADEQRELERRELAYRGGRPSFDVKDRTVIVVDDGIATGATIRAAARAIHAFGPARIIIATPAAAAATVRDLKRDVDEVVCLMMPKWFVAISDWYDDFSPVSDDEVRELLRRSTPPGRDVSRLPTFLSLPEHPELHQFGTDDVGGNDQHHTRQQAP